MPRPLSERRLASPSRHARGAAAILALAGLVASHAARAQCVLVAERGGSSYTPHIAIHFGDPADVPAHIQNSAPLDKRETSLCVPIYAYDLWEGADAVELSLHTPRAPLGFDLGADISSVTMSRETDASGVTTSLTLTPRHTLCGPVQLGCLLLPLSGLPQTFEIGIEENLLTGHRAVRTPQGEWRAAAVDEGGGRVGTSITRPSDMCELNRAVADLQARPGEGPGQLDLSWTMGSGSFTLLRYRMDGRYPSDPWDGELLAFLPAPLSRYTRAFALPGQVHVTAWSVTRGSHGYLYAASDVECGSIATSKVHLPVSVESTRWQQVKSLYR